MWEIVVWKEIEITSANSAANYHENHFFLKDHEQLYLPKIPLVMVNKSTDMQKYFSLLFKNYCGFFLNIFLTYLGWRTWMNSIKLKMVPYENFTNKYVQKPMKNVSSNILS